MKNNMSALSENWDQLSPEKKRDLRFIRMTESGKDIKFISPEAEQQYYKRLKRRIDVFNIAVPDRVPVSVDPGIIPFLREGFDYNTALHDPARAVKASLKFNAEYSAILDSFSLPFLIPAAPFEKLNFKLYAWPGYGVPSNGTGIQFVEGEYMMADEYDAFMKNPSDFWMRTYLPRMFGVFEPFRKAQALSDMVEFPIQLFKLEDPDMRASLRRLADAGDEFAKFSEIMKDYGRQSGENGFPSFPTVNGYVKAPFDAFGDNMRGTQGIMKDMYRQPEKLLKALDVMADLEIESVMTSADFEKCVKMFFALHKGADGWMSQKQFSTFYWPYLKKVLMACINEGLHPTLFVEGSFNTRLEYLTELPKGSVHLWFDQTDIFRAKKVLGDRLSIEGNVPSSLMVTGSPRDVKEHCRKLIEVCGVGGGYILACGASIENPKLENLVAMVEAAKEFGVY
jgi:hypothetical protein